jgi:hypothetical protein
MRNAETILGIIRERGRRKLPLEDIYRQLYNRDLFLRALTTGQKFDNSAPTSKIEAFEVSH